MQVHNRNDRIKEARIEVAFLAATAGRIRLYCGFRLVVDQIAARAESGGVENRVIGGNDNLRMIFFVGDDVRAAADDLDPERFSEEASGFLDKSDPRLSCTT